MDIRKFSSLPTGGAGTDSSNIEDETAHETGNTDSTMAQQWREKYNNLTRSSSWLDYSRRRPIYTRKPSVATTTQGLTTTPYSNVVVTDNSHVDSNLLNEDGGSTSDISSTSTTSIALIGILATLGVIVIILVGLIFYFGYFRKRKLNQLSEGSAAENGSASGVTNYAYNQAAGKGKKADRLSIIPECSEELEYDYVDPVKARLPYQVSDLEDSPGSLYQQMIHSGLDQHVYGSKNEVDCKTSPPSDSDTDIKNPPDYVDINTECNIAQETKDDISKECSKESNYKECTTDSNSNDTTTDSNSNDADTAQEIQETENQADNPIYQELE